MSPERQLDALHYVQDSLIPLLHSMRRSDLAEGLKRTVVELGPEHLRTLGSEERLAIKDFLMMESEKINLSLRMGKMDFALYNTKMDHLVTVLSWLPDDEVSAPSEKPKRFHNLVKEIFRGRR